MFEYSFIVMYHKNERAESSVCNAFFLFIDISCRYDLVFIAIFISYCFLIHVSVVILVSCSVLSQGFLYLPFCEECSTSANSTHGHISVSIIFFIIPLSLH